MSTTDYEKEFSCSHWSKRFHTPEEVIENFDKVCNTESEYARENFKCSLNVSYGDHEKEKIDIYGVDLPKDAPIFVYFHGGYWQSITKESSAYCVRQLVPAGIRVIVVEYELCPRITLAEIVNQIKKAAKYIIDMAVNARTKYISMAGHSAGAHLLLSMLDEDFVAEVGKNLNLIKNYYLISGAYDLRELRKTSINKDNILSLTEENVESLSPLLQKYSHLKACAAQIHILVAENESDEFKTQATATKKLLQNYNVATTLAVLPGLDHFDIVENLKNKNFIITKMILNDTVMS